MICVLPVHPYMGVGESESELRGGEALDLPLYVRTCVHVHQIVLGVSEQFFVQKSPRPFLEGTACGAKARAGSQGADATAGAVAGATVR